MIVVSFYNALDAIRKAETMPGILSSPQDPLGALLQSFLAGKAIEEKKSMEPLASGGREAKYDDKDWLGWAKSFFTWWRTLSPHDFVYPKSTPEVISNSFRIAVLGDWGTGLYGARKCAESIESDGEGYDLHLHLGDVYYSGTPSEVLDNFLQLWPRPRFRQTKNRALNSNHEMYGGAHAYFSKTLASFEQDSSCFSMQNANWLLVGLDTAYIDHDLGDEQLAWVSDLVDNAGSRRVILFSHHQPYSRFEKQGSKLQSKLSRHLQNKKIFAWYWGHEHRCVLYDPHPVWATHGRTVGHGGYPYFRKGVEDLQVDQKIVNVLWRRIGSLDLIPGALVLDGPNEYVAGHEDQYGPHGYLTIELNDDHLNEIIHAADGTVLFNRQLV
jgi:hypothetical protein